MNLKCIRMHWLNTSTGLVAEVQCALIGPLRLAGNATIKAKSFSLGIYDGETTETSIGCHILKYFFFSKIPSRVVVRRLVVEAWMCVVVIECQKAAMTRLTDGASRLRLHKNATARTRKSLDAVFVYNRTTARLVAAAGIIFTGHMFCFVVILNQCLV
jgi:hypothetical protein